MFLGVRKPVASFVFEDLGPQNFQLGSREKGLDLEHAKLVLKRLAQMHAASMGLLRKVILRSIYHKFLDNIRVLQVHRIFRCSYICR